MAADLGSIVKGIFNKKDTFQYIPEENKEDTFFIFNQYLSRSNLPNAQSLNIKNIDKARGVDIWNLFFKNQKVQPKNFWQRPSLKKSKTQQLSRKLGINQQEYEILEKYFPLELEEEFKNLEALEENGGYRK